MNKCHILRSIFRRLLTTADHVSDHCDSSPHRISVARAVIRVVTRRTECVLELLAVTDRLIIPEPILAHQHKVDHRRSLHIDPVQCLSCADCRSFRCERILIQIYGFWRSQRDILGWSQCRCWFWSRCCGWRQYRRRLRCLRRFWRRRRSDIIAPVKASGKEHSEQQRCNRHQFQLHHSNLLRYMVVKLLVRADGELS